LFESGEGGSGVPAVPTEFADGVCDAEVDGAVLCAASIVPAARKIAKSVAWIFMVVVPYWIGWHFVQSWLSRLREKSPDLPWFRHSYHEAGHSTPLPVHANRKRTPNTLSS
jgi:hypothetical protein